MLDPKFFLASVGETSWIPQVVVVRDGGAIRGIVYAKERKLRGFATGILYADATLDSMVAAAAGDRERIFQIGVAALMKRRGVWALRMLVPPDGFCLDALREGRSTDFDCGEVENHCYVPLPGDYNSFLEGLGTNTRRNFRYYRRRFSDAGHQYVPRLTLEEFAKAAAHLATKSVTGTDQAGIKRALDMFAVSSRPMLAGLRHRDGQWLSVVGGWYTGETATVFCQMNDDRDYKESSLSLVMRGYLIEELISRQIHRLCFWAGVGGALSRYRVAIPAVKVYLDKRSIAWRAIRGLFTSMAPLFPKRKSWISEWIARGE